MYAIGLLDSSLHDEVGAMVEAILPLHELSGRCAVASQNWHRAVRLLPSLSLLVEACMQSMRRAGSKAAEMKADSNIQHESF